MALDRVVEEAGRSYLQPLNPGDGKVGKRVLINNEDEIRAMVEKARRVHDFWSQLSIKQRGRYLRALERLIVKASDTIAKLIGEENGKVAVECWEEILVSLQLLHYYRKRGFSDLRKFKGTDPLSAFKQIETKLPPSSKGQDVGVVGVIVPWNYPLMIPMNIITRSLFYGNAVVLKPSEQTPRTGELIKFLTDQAWRESGFASYCEHSPIQVIQGDHAVGQIMLNLLNEDKLNFLVFCGSSGTGRKLKQAAKHKDRLELLLGGKDAFVVFEDCDLNMTINALVGSCLFNTGQSCSSTERVYVAESVVSVVVSGVLERVKRLRVGYNPDDHSIDLGAIMNRRQFEMIMRQLRDAKAKGAKVLFGGKRLVGGAYDLGYFLEPTVLVNVNHDMDIMTEETFGPIIPIMTAKNERELVRLANDCRFGLTASVWTGDISRGRRVAEKLEAGTVYVNDVFWTASEPKVHWPGAKESGNSIDEARPSEDKVIAVTKGNFIDRLSQFWLKRNTHAKLVLMRTLVKFAFRF